MSSESPDGDGDGMVDDPLLEALKSTSMEDPILTEYGEGSGDSNEVQERGMNMVEGWFPENQEWSGKTVIVPDQARALAAIRHLPELFEELEELEGFLDDMVTDYEKYLTSVGGEARKEQASILRAMFGGPSDEKLAERGSMLRLFTDIEDGDE